MDKPAPLADDAAPPPSHHPPARRSKRRRVRSFFRRWKSVALRHTWLSPLLACLAVAGCYAANPSEANPVRAALFLSYPLPQSDDSAPVQYGKGRRDFAFVAFYTVFLSFTRELLMQRVFRPAAIHYGIRSRAKQARFMEQAYTAVYFAVFGPLGLYVMRRSPVWYFDTAGMYEGYPHLTHEALFKAYYLLQASYWAQQMIVLLLMLEKPRKDFKELVAHHIITLTLIWLSYRFHFTYMGLAVYVTHDVSDFFLAVRPLNLPWDNANASQDVQSAQLHRLPAHHPLLRRLHLRLGLPAPLPQPALPLLHGPAPLAPPPDTTLALQRALAPVTSLLSPLSPALLSLKRRLLSVPLPPALLARLPALPATAQFAAVGPFTLDWAGQHYKFPLSQWITFGLLAALQAVNLFWLFLIARILWRMLLSFGDVVEDERSEYGSDDEEVDVEPAGEGVNGALPEENSAVAKRVGNGAVRAG